jgi:hypothetical protein
MGLCHRTTVSSIHELDRDRLRFEMGSKFAQEEEQQILRRTLENKLDRRSPSSFCSWLVSWHG